MVDLFHFLCIKEFFETVCLRIVDSESGAPSMINSENIDMILD